MPKYKLIRSGFSIVEDSKRRKLQIGEVVNLSEGAYKAFKDKFEIVKVKPVSKPAPKPKKKVVSTNE